MVNKFIKFINSYWLVIVLIFFAIFIFIQFVFLKKIPLPVDTLVGAYLPWLDYKWGYITGVPVKNALTSDSFSTFFVWKKLILDLYLHGVIPLWNKYSFSGTPLLATFHTSAFFPANLFMLLPLNLGWGIYIMGSTLAAFLSMYLFLGLYSSSKTGRIIGSLVYSFAGPMTTWAQFGTAVWAASILPLLLYCLDRALDTNERRYFTLTSVLISLLVFSGHVQILTYSAVLSPLYFIHCLRRHDHRHKFLITLNTLFAAVIGVLLGSIQLLPAFDFYSLSIRGEENYASTFNYGLSHFSQLIRLWAADFFGSPVTMNSFSSFSYHEFSSYLGALTFPFIIGGLFSNLRKSKGISFFIALFFISLFIAIDSPISRFIFRLPLPLLTYSSASRIFFLLNLAAGVLISQQIDQLIQRKVSLSHQRLIVIIFVLITLGSNLFVDHLNRNISFRNSMFYVSIFGFFILASIILSRKRTMFAGFLIFIFIFDMFRYYSKYNPLVNQNFVFPKTPVIDFLMKQKTPFRIAREDTNLLPANSWIAYSLESIEGYDPLYSSDYAHYFHRLNDNSYFNSVSRYALIDNINQKYFNAANVKYVLAKNTSEISSKSHLSGLSNTNSFQAVFIDKSVTVYENLQVLDRAYFVSKLRFVKNNEELGKLLDDKDYDPTVEAVAIGYNLVTSLTRGTVVSILHQDNIVKIDTQSTGEGFLVLADAYDPGWNVYINKKKEKIYQVNGDLRGVLVPAGRNEIIFKYQPKSFMIGLTLSVFAVCLLFLQFIFTKKNV